MVDLILAQEVDPSNRKKKYIEEILKPPNIIKSKEVLKAIIELKLSTNPSGHSLLKNNSESRNKFQNIRQVPPEEQTRHFGYVKLITLKKQFLGGSPTLPLF